MTIWRLDGNLAYADGLATTNLTMVRDKMPSSECWWATLTAVTVLEMAHRRQLINAGVLRTDSLLLPERPLPQGDCTLMTWCSFLYYITLG